MTVLFADVAGFTTLSEGLDPEAVHTLMDGCFAILSEQVHLFEGTINQYTGDGIMALFCAPITHEDHALRAAHGDSPRTVFLQDANPLLTPADDLVRILLEHVPVP